MYSVIVLCECEVSAVFRGVFRDCAGLRLPLDPGGLRYCECECALVCFALYVRGYKMTVVNGEQSIPPHKLSHTHIYIS